ncbi:MAG: hypothetical protein J0H01_35465 [Rhizobiales bacterium]|nr:hypothetical protein [Hyphomicrobiales bacterium]
MFTPYRMFTEFIALQQAGESASRFQGAPPLLAGAADARQAGLFGWPFTLAELSGVVFFLSVVALYGLVFSCTGPRRAAWATALVISVALICLLIAVSA